MASSCIENFSLLVALRILDASTYLKVHLCDSADSVMQILKLQVINLKPLTSFAFEFLGKKKKKVFSFLTQILCSQRLGQLQLTTKSVADIGEIKYIK